MGIQSKVWFADKNIPKQSHCNFHFYISITTLTYFRKKSPENWTFVRKVKQHFDEGFTTEELRPFGQPCEIVE